MQVLEQIPDAEGHQGIEHWVKQARRAFVRGFPSTPAFPNSKRGTGATNFHGRAAIPSRNSEFAL